MNRNIHTIIRVILIGRNYPISPLMVVCLYLAMLTGCMVGLDFKRPQVQVPDQWSGTVPTFAANSARVDEKELGQWWTVFKDQTLTALVERAIESNLDLKLAEARILQARAARGEAVSELGPTVDAMGSFTRSQSQITTFESGAPGSGLEEKTESVISNQYYSGFDASWELDFFGGVRRSIEAANADLNASIERRRDVLVTLTAEVARNYIDLRTYQRRLAIAQKNLKAQKQTAELTRQRFEVGFGTALDVANAEAQVATTAAQLPELEASAQKMIYNISVLLGREPAALMKELSPSSEVPSAVPSVPVGVPSELLRRRPDILQAEQEIHAATARIGVATADLFPKFNITGSLGYQSANISSWYDPVSLFWSLGPSISWNIFNTGRTRANIEVKKVLKEQSVIEYQQTVLVALQEVEDAMIASAKEEDRLKALADAVTANKKAVEISTILYTTGETGFLDVLVAQRSLYTSEDDMVQSTGTLSRNLVALYKALGGGWDVHAEAKQSP